MGTGDAGRNGEVDNFAPMKKSTIWIIAVVMGVSFLTLLYLQVGYVEGVIEIRKEQFGESVTRSLYQAARNMELDETQNGLELEVKRTLGLVNTPRSKRRQQQPAHYSLPDSLSGQEAARAELGLLQPRKRTTSVASGVGAKKAEAEDKTPELLREMIKERYIHQQGLLNEVIYSMLYEPSDKPLAERVNFQLLDRDLKSELRNNGINITYHFTVTTTDGREIYRCPDYENEGRQFSFKQILFPNDPAAQMGIITIHFPEMQKYLFSSVKFMIPAIIFTLILLIIFIFTIYTIFRQKHLTEIKNDFINNMTHEFKTPISTISLAAQMLNDPAVGKSEAMFKHISGIINDETKRLRFQVEKVLQMSMFDRKAGTFKQKEIDANALITDVVTTFRLKAEYSGGSIDTDLKAEDATIFVDEMHFTNVLFNLMDNAMKYKKPEEALHLEVGTRNENGKIVISVRDNGIGIKKKDLKKIFEKFYRVHTGNRHDVKGFGLGLAYVKKVIAYHKGSIHVESEYGIGTTFIITLPIIKT